MANRGISVTCALCTKWELQRSPMRIYGMGTCALEQGVFRQARTFSPTAPCNKEQFRQAAEPVIAARKKALAKVDSARWGIDT